MNEWVSGEWMGRGMKSDGWMIGSKETPFLTGEVKNGSEEAMEVIEDLKSVCEWLIDLAIHIDMSWECLRMRVNDENVRDMNLENWWIYLWVYQYGWMRMIEDEYEWLGIWRMSICLPIDNLWSRCVAVCLCLKNGRKVEENQRIWRISVDAWTIYLCIYLAGQELINKRWEPEEWLGMTENAK